MNSSSRPIAVDLFCGAGGMSLGFEQAGFDIALGVDVDGHHVAAHHRNFPYSMTLCRSVVDLSGKEVKDLVGGREVDIMFGGPPCQGFSFMGLRNLKDPRNSLIDHFARLVLEVRPKAFVMENVPGLLAGKTRKILDQLVSVMEANGYTITKPIRCLDASEFGVPQRRKRVLVLGIRSDLGCALSYPDGPCTGQPQRPTVWEAISDLPKIEELDELYTNDNTKYDAAPTSHYAKVARGALRDHSDFSRTRKWDLRVCSGCSRTKHSPKSVELYRATSPGEFVPGHKLPKLDPNGLAPTLRAGSESSHGSHTAPRPVHPKNPRCITTREAARLHGYPDWFGFYPTKWQSLRQIGNSVCPPVARAIGARVLSALNISPLKPADQVPLKDIYELPTERQKQLKRIPVLNQFAPVIAHLFSKASEFERGADASSAQFTYADVKKAIAATGVNLHWVTAHNFISELSRMRRRDVILAPIRQAGFTIKPVRNGSVIGEFVPINTPGTIDDKETLQIRVREIHGAVQLPIQISDVSALIAKLPRLLAFPDFVKALWGENATAALSGGPNCSAVTQIIVRPSGKSRFLSLAVLCDTRSLPPRSKLQTLAAEHGAAEVLVLARATTQHLVALRFTDAATNPREDRRLGFRLRTTKHGHAKQ